MKITKLFHWLYALVMFLPILFFIPNVFYYAFNEHAVNESSTEVDIQYKYQSNEVSNNSDLIDGNIYHFWLDDETIDPYLNRGNSFGIQILSCISYDFSAYGFTLENYNLNFSSDTYQDSMVEIEFNGYDASLYTYLLGDDYALETYIGDLSNDAWSLDCIVLLTYSNINQTEFYNLFSYTDFNVIEDVEVITDVEETITQKVYYGWQSVWSLPVFSWTSNTFFSAPFNYISGLFGFQAGNTLSNCLSYWFSISIIWLTFDLMMYVPLLVHKWLDKASIS